jgi:hypothetical protein
MTDGEIPALQAEEKRLRADVDTFIRRRVSSLKLAAACSSIQQVCQSVRWDAMMN